MGLTLLHSILNIVLVILKSVVSISVLSYTTAFPDSRHHPPAKAFTVLEAQVIYHTSKLLYSVTSPNFLSDI